MPKNLSVVNGVVDNDNLFTLNVNRETLQESNIIKVIPKNIVRKAIEMLHKLAERDKSKKESDDNIGDDNKKVGINEVVDTDNEELVVDAANGAPPPQDAMTTTTEAAAEEGRDDDMGAKDGGGNDEAEDTKGGEEGGAIRRSNTATTTTKRM